MYRLRPINFSSILFFIFLFLTMTTCKKDKDEIPNVSVNILIDPNSTQYLPLNSTGGYVYLTGGVKGIIVYRLSMNEFMAYERDCPYQPSNSCAQVEVQASGLTLIDSCCGSKFIITDGSVINGPANRSLKYYNNTYDGNMLHIYN
jgi:nitrite reductase/ring-hydroxylating ferredoxin subunit